MPTTKKTNNQSSRQVDRFREAARELETDQSEEAFDRALKKIAKAAVPKDERQSKPEK